MTENTTWVPFATEKSEDHPYCYWMYTVNGMRLTAERVVWGQSAEAVAQQAIDNGFIRVEVSPYSKGGENPVRSKDIAVVDIRESRKDWREDPMAPCPDHIEIPGQNCPTCGF